MQILDRTWMLAPDPENVGRKERWFETGPTPGARPAPVPGTIQQVFPDYHGVAWYWLRFEPVRPVRPGGRRQLYFCGGVDYLGEVWLNGCYVGSYEGGEGPFDLDVTVALRPGEENLLAVRVLNPTHEPIDGYVLKEVPHRNKIIPYRPGASYNYGGILLPVELRQVPEVRVTDCFARPNVHDGTVPLTITLRNETSTTLTAQLAARIGPALGQGSSIEATTRETVSLRPGEQSVDLCLAVGRPHLWDLDDPYLYRVSLQLQALLDGQTIEDEYSLRCGFREFRVEGGFFRLNGRRVFVRSTHTGNHFPFGQGAPMDPDLVRRDLINAKATGFNMVRFISGAAMPEQLDFCDDLGLMVYEECLASWCLEDSAQMAERFRHSYDAMVLRDRNHPCVTVWGLLNETRDGPVFRHAVDYLPRLRQLDDTRLVLLSSGRWDCQWDIGSVSNPGSSVWEHVWGIEDPEAEPASGEWDPGLPGGYFQGAGDAHLYPRTPQTLATNHLLRTLGNDTKPVFVSEYGIGSLLNVIRESRRFEEARARADLSDVRLIRSWADRLTADWERWGFDGVYPFPEDMLRDSQRLHARQRLLGFDLLRSNPQICGYNLTGMLDHGMTGEGLWTYTREWKPGIVDALSDGWAPLRWCLFVEPMNGYTGRPLHVNVVLANEDVLPPGCYPVRLRIVGPAGVAWERRVDLSLPAPVAGEDPPLAVPVYSEEIEIEGPAGAYVLAAYMDQGGAPAGGRLGFHLADPSALPSLDVPVTLWGIDPQTSRWLSAHGATVRPFTLSAPDQRQVILVGRPAAHEQDAIHWQELVSRVARGSTAVFLSPHAFAQGKDALAWLPLATKGRVYEFHDWLYHKECVAKRHRVFSGLQSAGIMDWDYWGPVIPHWLYEGQDAPDEVLAAAFAVSTTTLEGYASGLLLGSYDLGAGRFVLNTIPLLDHIDVHPAADRLLLNLISEASCTMSEPLVEESPDLAEMVSRFGYDREGGS